MHTSRGNISVWGSMGYVYYIYIHTHRGFRYVYIHINVVTEYGICIFGACVHCTCVQCTYTHIYTHVSNHIRAAFVCMSGSFAVSQCPMQWSKYLLLK